jgi:type I restriction enzyme R subunit
MLQRVPVDSFPVRKVWAQVESAWSDAFWLVITKDKLEFLRLQVAPLLRYIPDVDVAAESFTHKVERLKLQMLRGSPSPDLLQSIAEDASRLPPYLMEDPSRRGSVQLALSNELATATSQVLTRLIADLSNEMKNKRRPEVAFLKIDLPDFIEGKNYILLGAARVPVHVEEYRRRVERRIMDIADGHPALNAIRDGNLPTEDQLLDLERVLHSELTSAAIQLSSKTVRQAYGLNLDNRLGFLGFARHILALDAIPDYEAVVARGFEEFITSHNYSADQIRFLRSVQEVFIAKGRLSEADLYEPPLTNFGRNAVERYFAPTEIKAIIALAEHLAAA